MSLRRITEHVKAQNWFAVGIDHSSYGNNAIAYPQQVQRKLLP